MSKKNHRSNSYKPTKTPALATNLTLEEIETIFDVKHGKKSNNKTYLMLSGILLVVIAVALYFIIKN